MIVSYKEIVKAKKILERIVHRTDMIFSNTFSSISGGMVYLKAENLQKTGSFKIRGAYYKISTLSEEEKKLGVAAVSAGNHAQGVALAASMFGIKSTIVMPEFAPMAKIVATRNYGAQVILHGRNIDQAREKAFELAAKGMVLVHPFDDPYVIAGQGTVGIEMLEDVPDIDAIIVPVGGGGLISGVAAAVKKIKPSIKIIGVEVEGYDALKLSLQKGQKLCVAGKVTLADGIAVGVCGDIAFETIKEYVDQIVVVSDEEVSAAILWLLERAKYVVEGAGAVGVAAILANKINVAGSKVGVVLSGGNIDLSMLQLIIDKGLIKEGRRVEIRVLVPDKPGQLKGILELLSNTGVNIYSINHNRIREGIMPGFAEVELVLETRDKDHAVIVVKNMQEIGYTLR